MVQDLVPTPEEFDFSFAWITDTQNYPKAYPQIYDSMTQWIVDNRGRAKHSICDAYWRYRRWYR